MSNGSFNIRPKQQGYTLVEMLVVLILITLLAAMTVSRLYTGHSETGGAERVLDEVAARLAERRADAVRLNGQERREGLEDFAAPPLPFDFADFGKTGSLRLDGEDADGDCVDDVTHTTLTCLRLGRSPDVPAWQLACNEDALRLPDGWSVALHRNQLYGIPLIAGGERGRGVLVTALGFTANGQALARLPDSAEWSAYPDDAVTNETPNANDAPFWAVYFTALGPGTVRNREVTAIVAVAVHPSGLVEKFRYDGGEWLGFDNRVAH